MLLNYDADPKKTKLTIQLWFNDTAGHMEAMQENGGNAVWWSGAGTYRGVESSKRWGGCKSNFHSGQIPSQRCQRHDSARA